MEQIDRVRDEVVALANAIPRAIQHKEELIESCDWLLLIRKKTKSIEELHDRIIGPMEAALRTIRAEFRGMFDSLERAETELKSAIAWYAERKHDDATLRQIEEIKNFETRLQKALGTDESVEPPAVIDAPSTLVETPSGQIIISTIKDWVVANLKIIPEEYWQRVLDKARIGKEIRAGKLIPGVRIIPKRSVAVKPNK